MKYCTLLPEASCEATVALGGGGGGNFFAKNYCSRVGGFVIVVVQMCWGSPGSTMATGKGIRMDYSSGLSYNSAL